MRRNAHKQYIGGELSYIQGMPKYIEKLEQEGHSAKLVSLNKEQMLDVVIKCEERTVAQHNKYIPKHLSPLPFDETALRATMTAKMRTNVRYGYAMLYCSKVAKDMFNTLTPVFQGDAAH